MLIINVVPQGPHWLARLATFGTPALAASYGWFRGSPRWWVWPPIAAGLWFAAWLASGLAQDAAGTALIAVACLAAASAIAMAAPAWSIRVGLVALAALDVVLVWGTPSVERATQTLEGVPSPVAAGTPLPSLQQATFGSALMGWLDLLAPALLGVVVVGRRKLGAAVVTGVAAGLWGLLLLTHLGGRRDGARSRRASVRRCRCASQSSPTSTRTCTRWRRSSQRSTRRHLTSSGASGISSATDRGRTSAARRSPSGPTSASQATTTSPCAGRSTSRSSAARPRWRRGGRETCSRPRHRRFSTGWNPKARPTASPSTTARLAIRSGSTS